MTFKKALSTLHRLKKAEDKAYYQKRCKALPRLGGNGKIPGGIPHLRHHHDDGLDTDRTGKPEKSVKRLFMCVRQQQTFFNLGNVYVFDITIISIHGEELLRKFTVHQKYLGESHFNFNADVRDI